MSLIVECQCGKRFKAKDELAGKSLPCPGCGAMLTVPMRAAPIEQAPNPLPPTRTPATMYPGRRTTAPPQKDSPRFAISPRMVIFIVILILVPTIIFLAKIGPVAAMDQWKQFKPTVEGDMNDIVNRYLEAEFRKRGIRMIEARDVPHFLGVVVDEPVMFMTFPKSVAVQGTSTEGRFKGTYYTQTRQFKGTIDVRFSTNNVTATANNGNITFDP